MVCHVFSYLTGTVLPHVSALFPFLSTLEMYTSGFELKERIHFPKQIHPKIQNCLFNQQRIHKLT